LNKHKKKSRRAGPGEVSRIIKCPPEFTLPLYNRTVYVGDNANFSITGKNFESSCEDKFC